VPGGSVDIFRTVEDLGPIWVGSSPAPAAKPVPREVRLRPDRLSDVMSARNPCSWCSGSCERPLRTLIPLMDDLHNPQTLRCPASRCRVGQETTRGTRISAADHRAANRMPCRRVPPALLAPLWPPVAAAAAARQEWSRFCSLACRLRAHVPIAGSRFKAHNRRSFPARRCEGGSARRQGDLRARKRPIELLSAGDASFVGFEAFE
jgi:hypothetical protein